MTYFTLNVPVNMYQEIFYLNELNNCYYNISKEMEEGDSVIIDLKNTKWINAELAVILSNYIELFLEKKIKLYHIHSASDKVNSILNRNNFLPYYGLGEKLDDLFETTVQFTVKSVYDITEIDEYIEESLFRSLKRNISDSFEQYIKETLFELIHNVRDHSGSSKVFMCGQYYHSKNKLHFAISDIGIGISENIKSKNTGIILDSEAIIWALERGNSTKGRPDAGLGLYELSSKLKGRGSLAISSGNVLFKITIEGDFTIESYDNRVDGTSVFINFDVNECSKDLNYDNMETIIEW